jgi:hypothetical protein
MFGDACPTALPWVMIFNPAGVIVFNSFIRRGFQNPIPNKNPEHVEGLNTYTRDEIPGYENH